MLESQPIVVSVGHNDDKYAKLESAAKNLKLSIERKNSIQELFKILNGTNNVTNLVLFNIEKLFFDTNIFDILNTISTITHCNGKTTSPVLAVSVSEHTNPNTIRHAMAADIKGFIQTYNEDFTDDFEMALRTLLDDKCFISKSITDKLKRAKTIKKNQIHHSVNGIQLTIRQEQVLKLICERGASNKNIARLLNLSESTVKLHIGAILQKYGLKNRTQLALFTKNHYNQK